MMKDTFQAINEMIFSDSMWMLLYIMSLLYVIALKNRLTKKGYTTFFWYIIFCGLIIWYPFIINFVKSHFFSGDVEYARFSIVLMIFPLVAYTVTILYTEGKKKNRKLALLALGLLIILIGKWNPVDNINKPTNIYKMPDNVIKITNRIESDHGNLNNINVCFLMQDNVDYINDNQPETRLYWGMNQYANGINMTSHVYSTASIEADDFKVLDDTAAWGSYDYLLCTHNKKMETQLITAGYIKIMTDDACNVYRKP